MNQKKSSEILEDEIWKDIPGYAGYQASSLGRVRFESKILNQSRASNGYLTVRIGGKNLFAHRAVLFAFSGVPNKGMEGAHLDGTRDNNRISNLKWCTPKENSSHKVLHGTAQVGELQPRSKLKKKHVLEILDRLDAGEFCGDIAKEFNVHQSTISLIKHGKNWSEISLVRSRLRSPAKAVKKPPRLTPEMAERINSLLSNKLTCAAIARQLGFNLETVRAVKLKRPWAMSAIKNRMREQV